jgi:hypothetical protein
VALVCFPFRFRAAIGGGVMIVIPTDEGSRRLFNHRARSPIETMPTMPFRSKTGRCRMRLPVINTMASDAVVPGSQ